MAAHTPPNSLLVIRSAYNSLVFTPVSHSMHLSTESTSSNSGAELCVPAYLLPLHLKRCAISQTGTHTCMSPGFAQLIDAPVPTFSMSLKAGLSNHSGGRQPIAGAR